MNTGTLFNVPLSLGDLQMPHSVIVPVNYAHGPIQEMARASKKCWLNTSTTTMLLFGTFFYSLATFHLDGFEMKQDEEF